MDKKELYIIFGPPGSGKTTQAKYIAKTLRLENVSWGEIYRDTRRREKHKALFSVIDDDITSNELRSKAITKVIESEIDLLPENTRGVIMDGYPRRIEEAFLVKKILKKYDFQLEALIRINPSIQRAYERFNKRYICPFCLKHYDDELNPPSKSGFCDGDSTPLEQRTTSKERIQRDFYSYLEESNPAYEFLKKYSATYFDVSGEDDDIVMFSNILLKIKQKERNDYKIYDRKSSARVETQYGTFKICTYQSKLDYSHHLALVKGKVTGGRDVLVRVHSSCITGDIFGSQKCECGEQLHQAMQRIEKAGRGILVYLFQEGRGINIINKIEAYDLQNHGLDTVQANERLGFPAELRQYLPVRDILNDLRVKTITLMTNNPDKIRKITDLGIVINDAAPLEIKPGQFNSRYLNTKKLKMSHKLREV